MQNKRFFISQLFLGGFLFFFSGSVSAATQLPLVTLQALQRSYSATLPTPNNGLRLYWNTKFADVCIASGSWQGSKALNGDIDVSSLSSPETFILSCNNVSGSTKAAFTINVLSLAPGPVVNFNLLANGMEDTTTIAPGDSVTLSWDATQASSCMALNNENYLNGVQPIQGSFTVPKITANTVFVLTCFNSQGSYEDSVTINIRTPATSPVVLPSIIPPAAPSASHPLPSLPASSSQATGVIITRWLIVGSTGADVKALQEYLKKLGYFPSAQETTTFFGFITRRSVQKFQCAKLQVCAGTPESTGYGATGPKTRSALSSIR